MALTINIAQVPSTQVPGIGFYVIVQTDDTELVYDQTAVNFLPLANATNYKLTLAESPSGSGNWTISLDASAWLDGFYNVTAYESTQNQPASTVQHLLLRGGVLSTTAAAAQVTVNHNTGGTDVLRYVDGGGNPISGADVRVYTQADWTAQALSHPVGITATGNDGRWLNPVYVTAGQTYVVQFQLQQAYGPDTATVTV